MLDIECNVKMFLFARWMVEQYSSATLNTEEGIWWKEQLIYFNEKVYPEYIKNGTLQDTLHFMDRKYQRYQKAK
jgi:hypothetical protein